MTRLGGPGLSSQSVSPTVHLGSTYGPPDMARAEIRDSKKRLEDTFGVAIRHFCYPYGDWNLAVRDIAIEAGYATAVTTDFGVNTTSNSPFELKRVTARYPSRSWPSLFGALQSLFKTRRGKELD